MVPLPPEPRPASLRPPVPARNPRPAEAITRIRYDLLGAVERQRGEAAVGHGDVEEAARLVVAERDRVADEVLRGERQVVGLVEELGLGVGELVDAAAA